jgi:hypothetical protein
VKAGFIHASFSMRQIARLPIEPGQLIKLTAPMAPQDLFVKTV